MSINFSSLSETLVYMGKGMLGIFIVTAVIILSMMILNKVFSSQSNSGRVCRLCFWLGLIYKILRSGKCYF